MTLERKTGFSHENAGSPTRKQESASRFKRFCARVKGRISDLVAEPAKLPLEPRDPITPEPEKVLVIGSKPALESKLPDVPLFDNICGMPSFTHPPYITLIGDPLPEDLRDSKAICASIHSLMADFMRLNGIDSNYALVNTSDRSHEIMNTDWPPWGRGGAAAA